MSAPTYGVGIVGFGFMGKAHTYGYRTIPFYYGTPPIRYALKGVCVRRPEVIEAAVGLGGFEFGTTRYEELLERDDIHIIHVCTPNHLHRAQVIAAIEAGKHVYCDKPLAHSYADCQAILAAIAAADPRLVTQMAHQYRYYPCTMRARQLIDQGMLGRVFSFRASYLHASSIDPDKPLGWKLDRQQGGGGVLYDLGSHVLDLVGDFVGPFQQVMAATSTAITQRWDPVRKERVDVQTDDLALLLLRTADGALGSIEASKIATGANDELRVEIHGAQGAFRLNLMDPNWLEVYDIRDAARPLGGARGFKRLETVSRYPEPGGAFPPPACNVGWLRAHVACLHNFLAAVGGTGSARPTLAEAAAVQRVMDAAYQSADRGTWQTV